MRFTIVGGSFGEKGRLSVTEQLHINGPKQAEYSFSDIANVVASKGESIKKTSWLSVIVGLFITFILTIFFNIIGFAIGIIITIIGSSYTKKGDPLADITFNDGKSLKVEGSKGAINKLISRAP